MKRRLNARNMMFDREVDAGLGSRFRWLPDPSHQTLVHADCQLQPGLGVLAGSQLPHNPNSLGLAVDD